MGAVTPLKGTRGAARRRRGRPSSVDREAVLAATLRVIAQRGLDRARYVDIAEASGVASSTLQHAFGRLDEMLAAALDLAHERERVFLDGLPSAEDADPWARMTALVEGAVGPLPVPSATLEAGESWLVWVELWRGGTREPALGQRAARQYECWWAATEQIIRDGQRSGAFTDAVPSRELSMAVNAVIDGLAIGALASGQVASRSDARAATMRAVRRLLSDA